MANNLKVLKERIETDIDPLGAPGSILAQNHQEILIDVLNNVGKNNGAQYLAHKTLTNYTNGKMSWNSNAMNNTSDFIMTFAKLTSDLNDFGQILSRLKTNDLLRFKDFVGRSVDLIFQFYEADVDGSGNPVYNVTVKGVAQNVNYVYQDTEIENSVISLSAKAQETSEGQRRRAVINIVDNAVAPPTEVDGDRYILDNTGASHADWDGASANSIVQYDGGSDLWVEEVPEEGWVVYVDDLDVDWRYVDDGVGQWEAVPTGALPPGGTTAQVLKKQSNTDGDADWEDESPSDYVTETTITDLVTVFDGTQKGAFNIWRFENTSLQTVEIDPDDYAVDDLIIFQAGQGLLEILPPAGKMHKGVRDVDNRWISYDPDSLMCAKKESDGKFLIFGNLKRGYGGAPITTSYGSLSDGDVNKDVVVIGQKFSDNMVVSVIGNATLNSWSYQSPTQITLNLTETGSIGDFITVIIDNGQILTDTDAIEITDGIPTANLVRYYRFNDDVTDEKGIGDGTPTDITYVAGKSGNCADFNGTTSIVSVPDAGDISFPSLPFSVSLWVKFDAIPGSNGILVEKQNSGSQREWALFYAGVLGLMRFQVQSPNGTLFVSCDDDVTAYATGTWYHIVVTNDGSNDAVGSKFYLNGSLVASTNNKNGAYVGMTAGTANIYMGSRQGSTNGINGQIDGLGIWNVELSASEIATIYAEQNAGNELL